MESLSIGFVPGVTPGKWLTRWRGRHPEIPIEAFQCETADQISVLFSGRADMSFVRLPVQDADLHIIPLYTEQSVVVGHKEHEIAVFDEVHVDDLDEPILDPQVVGGEAMAVEVAASGAGLVILPMSIARLHNRKDVVFRPVTGVEQSRIGLAWPVANTSELTEEFVGIVRGRTANSSRQPLAAGQKGAGRKSPGGTSGGRNGSGGKSAGRNGSGRKSAGRNRRRGGGR